VAIIAAIIATIIAAIIAAIMEPIPIWANYYCDDNCGDMVTRSILIGGKIFFVTIIVVIIATIIAVIIATIIAAIWSLVRFSLAARYFCDDNSGDSCDDNSGDNCRLMQTRGGSPR
jgi:hypothetical protein